MSIDKEELREQVIENGVFEDWVEQNMMGIESMPDGQLKAVCPWHDDHTPSLSINLQKGVCYCFACGEGGDLYKLRMHVEQVDFRTVLMLFQTDLQDARNEDPTGEKRKATVRLVKGATKKERRATSFREIDTLRANLAQNDFYSKWLCRERGITNEETLTLYRLGLPWKFDVGVAIVLPMIHTELNSEGQVLEYPDGMKVYTWEYVENEDRYKKNDPWLEAGQYGVFGGHLLHELGPDVPVLICEGEWDAMVAHEVYQGAAACVSPGYGAKNWRPEWSPWFAGRDVFIVYDADDAGRKGAQIVARSVVQYARSVYIVDLFPENDGTDKQRKDITDWIVRHKLGAEAFADRVAEGVQYMAAPESEGEPSEEQTPTDAPEEHEVQEGTPTGEQDEPSTTDAPQTKKRKKKNANANANVNEPGKDQELLAQRENDKDILDAQVKKYIDRYALVKMGAAAVVVDMRVLAERHEVEFSTVETFHTVHMNRRVTITNAQGKPEEVALSRLWVKHPMRKTYARIVFDPEEKHSPSELNTWFGISPDLPAVEGTWPKIEYHIREVICGGDPQAAENLLDYMAHAIQKPWERPQFGVFMQSDCHGTGKGIFAEEIFAPLVGAHNFQKVEKSQELLGQHNKHLATKMLVYADESFFAGDIAQANQLKTFMSSKTLNIRPLYVDMYTVRAYHRVLASANSIHHLHAEPTERRWLVLKVNAKYSKKNKEYHRPLLAAIPSELPAFKFFLLHRDILEFDIAAPYETEALMDQIDMSKGVLDLWWDSVLDEEQIVCPNRDVQTFPQGGHLVADISTKHSLLRTERPLKIAADAVHQAYQAFVAQNTTGAGRTFAPNPNKLKVFLEHKGVPKRRGRDIGGDRRYYYDFSRVADTLLKHGDSDGERGRDAA